MRRPREDFRRLIQKRPRLGCVLTVAGYAVGIPLAMMPGTWSHLLAAVCVASSVAAFFPLRAYTTNVHHDRVLGSTYKKEDRRISNGQKFDDYEARLSSRTDHLSFWTLGCLMITGLVYAMVALALDLWVPDNVRQLGWIVFAVSSLMFGLPTVLAAWIYKDDHDLQYSALEDVE